MAMAVGKIKVPLRIMMTAAATVAAKSLIDESREV